MKSTVILGFAVIFFLFVFNVAPLAQEEDAQISYCRLTSDQNLWSGPSRNFKVVRQAKAGLLLEVIAEKGDYYRVHVPDGFKCYIATDYLEVDDGGMGTVKGSNVNLRSIPRVEGDYPIFKVNGGDRLYVWDKIGDWYCISAPAEAYAYVLKTAVTPVTDDVSAEMTALNAVGVEHWQRHRGSYQEVVKAKEEADQVQAKFKFLENQAQRGFDSISLEAAQKGYDEVAAATQDDRLKELSHARSAELEAIIARRDAEDEMKLRQDNWRREREELTQALDRATPIKPRPATHKSPGQGRLVKVVGLVDARGSEITLKGGKTPVDILYRVESPDGRYILSDFHGKRLTIVGRIGILAQKETVPLVVVERIELL